MNKGVYRLTCNSDVQSTRMQGRNDHVPSGTRRIWLLLGALGVPACGGDAGLGPSPPPGPPPPPPRVGAVRVSTATAGDAQDPDGYAVSLDGGAPRSIGVNGEVLFEELPPGQYVLAIAGIADNCVVTGGETLDITVFAGRTESVAFAVQCIGSGALRVTTNVTGTGPDPSYDVAVDGASIGTIGSNETSVFSDLGARGVTVSLGDIAQNCSVTQNDLSVEIPHEDTASVAFDVDCEDIGSLQVRTITTGAGPDPSYAVLVDLAFVGAIGSNATRTFSGIDAGTVSVALSDVAPHCTVANNSQSAVISAGATTSLTFNVTCPEETTPADITLSTVPPSTLMSNAAQSVLTVSGSITDSTAVGSAIVSWFEDGDSDCSSEDGALLRSTNVTANAAAFSDSVAIVNPDVATSRLYCLRVEAVDVFGNAAQDVRGTDVTWQPVAPGINLVTSPPLTLITPADSITLSVSGSITDASGIASAVVTWWQDGDSDCSTMDGTTLQTTDVTATAASFANSVVIVTPGGTVVRLYCLRVDASDPAGNTQTQSAATTVFWDKAPPIITLSTFPPATLSTSDATLTLSTSGTVTDAGGGLSTAIVRWWQDGDGDCHSVDGVMLQTTDVTAAAAGFTDSVVIANPGGSTVRFYCLGVDASDLAGHSSQRLLETAVTWN